MTSFGADVMSASFFVMSFWGISRITINVKQNQVFTFYVNSFFFIFTKNSNLRGFFILGINFAYSAKKITKCVN